MHDVPTTAPETEVPEGKPSRSPLKFLILWIIIICVAVLLLWLSLTVGSVEVEISYNQFREWIDEGKVEVVTIRERRIIGSFKQPIDSRWEFQLVLPFESNAAFVDELVADGIIVYGEQFEDSPMLTLFLTWGPVLLIVALWIYFMRKYTRHQT